MNRDSDITKTILLRLLLESDSVEDVRSGAPHLTNAMPPDWPQPNASSPGDERFPPSELGQVGSDASVPFDSFDPNLLDPSIGADPNAVFDPGDLPVVQNHFEAILKRRLATEIAQRPPLFPWEKGLQDYPDVLTPDDGLVSIWLEHLQNLQLPRDLPQDVLAELLRQCQQAAEQTRQIGRRLVSAVESLFPDQPQTLDYIAGLVARPAYRSSAQAASLAAVDYATASAQQQIALTMLAAQSIFEALSLSISATTPTEIRTWLTAAGALTVNTTYLSANQLEVRVQLPQAGAIVLTGKTETLHADRSTPGDLIMQVAVPAVPSAYTLEVSLGDHGAAPLRFQIVVESN